LEINSMLAIETHYICDIIDSVRVMKVPLTYVIVIAPFDLAPSVITAIQKLLQQCPSIFHIQIRNGNVPI
jgi:hypothetical protein